MHYCAKPIEKVWKVTALTRSWLLIRNKSTVSCLWQNLLRVLGLGGFTPREVTRGPFQLEEFQMMEDPLVVKDKYGPVVKEVRIKLNIINFINICVKHVEQCKLLCIHCYRRWKGMRK